MRIPDPIANTTTEAYLAYKAGVLSEGELKPKLYDPYIHLDAWLAYWAGLTSDYPNKGTGKNLLDASATPWVATIAYAVDGTTNYWANYYGIRAYQPVIGGQTYTLSSSINNKLRVCYYDSSKTFLSSDLVSKTFTTPSGCAFVRWSEYVTSEPQNTQLEKGSEATDYEPYELIPEMLTDEEALIAYLSGVTNTYPEEFRDPADVRVAAYLKYLVSARWGRPEYPVTNEELYLSMMDAPYIPAGEPSSDIEIDDTAEAPFKDVKMYGDTSQQTYSGINLLNKPQSYSFTRDLNFQMLPAGTYYVSCGEVTKGGENAPEFGDSSNHISLTSNMLNSVLTVSSSVRLTAYSNGWSWGDSAVTSTVEKLIVTSSPISTLDDYEPYVGGVPAPNPDYPQAVNTVTGRQVVKVEGKNLFDSSKIIVGDIQNANTTIRLHSSQILWLEAGTYTFSTNLPTPLRYSISTTDSGYPPYAVWPTWDYNSSWQDSARTTTFTLAKGGYFSIQLSKPNNATLTLDEFTPYNYQLEKGSTATDYLPYQSGEYEINLGKNLFNIAGDLTYSGYPVSPTNNGDGTLTTTANYNRQRASGQKINCISGETYTVSGKLVSHTGTGNTSVVEILSGLMGGVTVVKREYITTDGSFSYSFVAPADVSKLWISFSSVGADTQAVFGDIQIELGSTPTSYAAYFEPIELCKIGTYQDYIYENDGKWYLHKAVRHFSLLPSNMNNYEDTPGWRDITQLSQDLGIDHNGTLATWTNYKCNVILPDATAGLHLNINTIAQWNNNVLVVTGSGITQTQWKNNYSSQAFEVYYGIVNTSADTEITNTALVDQLNALKNGGSYTGTTYIKVSATDPNLPGLLKVEAYKYD